MKHIITYLLLIICISANAQIEVARFVEKPTISKPSFNSVGGKHNISPILFKYDSCINIETGLQVILPRNKGRFVNPCIETIKFNELGIGLFPVPVIRIATLRATKQPNLSQSFTIRVYDMLGRLVRTERTDGYTLYQGFKIDFDAQEHGAFVLIVESNHSRDVIKFIKAD